MRVFRYNGILVYLLFLLIIKNIANAQDCTPQCEARKLIHDKDYSYPFMAMLVRATETQIKLSSVVALGNLISKKWLLTKYTAINTRAKLVAIGFDSLTVPSNLEKVQKHPVLWINHHPKISKHLSCSSNIALLRLEKEDIVPDALVYWWLRPSNKQEKIRVMESIYWVFNTVNNTFEKYTMPWCPHYSIFYENCNLQKTITPTCISAELPSKLHFPGEEDTVTQGGPFMVENAFQGIYLGKGPNYLKRDIKRNINRAINREINSEINREIKPNEHFATRILTRTSVDKDLDTTASWIELVIDKDQKGELFHDEDLTTPLQPSKSSQQPATKSLQELSSTSQQSSTISDGSATDTNTPQTTTSSESNETSVTTASNVTKETTLSQQPATTSSQELTSTSQPSSTISDGSATDTEITEIPQTTTSSESNEINVTTPNNVTKGTTSSVIHSKTTKKMDWRQLCLMFDDNGSRHQKSSILLLVISFFFICFLKCAKRE